ncbi:hypothetical protein [Lentilactobacillus sp. SPB1-3]|uniref:Uncharacterized protein n=1 Tax=Lentilactobacillus terminaliae TaxID=3003483 RepID=A0ACD5DFD8_9LACO|nr:hypothetical protein [Lentilactobacillus sp. SPB1-3]MCZ0976268.1 hypothetical protein [Lentilactobacillus sp. SPB1-3]
MKSRKPLGLLFAVFTAFVLILAGCQKNNSSATNNDDSKASMQNPTEKQTAKQALNSVDNLWYMNGKINYNSKSGIDAYHFNSKNNTVTIYSVSKVYKNMEQAKKANDLNKQGTLKYTFSNKSADNPVIHMKGKLAGIPMEQTVSVHSKVSGKYNKTNVKVTGYKVVRDLDEDKTSQVLVTPQQ